MVIIQNGRLPRLPNSLTGLILSFPKTYIQCDCHCQISQTNDQDMHLTDGYYEIIGSVKEDKSVKALTSIELGPSLGRSRSPIFLSYRTRWADR
jgi:hypothetical protein